MYSELHMVGSLCHSVLDYPHYTGSRGHFSTMNSHNTSSISKTRLARCFCFTQILYLINNLHLCRAINKREHFLQSISDSNQNQNTLLIPRDKLFLLQLLRVK